MVDDQHLAREEVLQGHAGHDRDAQTQLRDGQQPHLEPFAIGDRGQQAGERRRLLALQGALLKEHAGAGHRGDGRETVGRHGDQDMDHEPAVRRAVRRALLRDLAPDRRQDPEYAEVGRKDRRQAPGVPRNRGNHGEESDAHRDRHPKRHADARLPGAGQLDCAVSQGAGHGNAEDCPERQVALAAAPPEGQQGRRHQGEQRGQAEHQIVCHDAPYNRLLAGAIEDTRLAHRSPTGGRLEVKAWKGRWPWWWRPGAANASAARGPSSTKRWPDGRCCITASRPWPGIPPSPPCAQ